MNENTDFIHLCDSGVVALDQEDMLKTGNWNDHTGSENVPQPLLAGVQNKVWGERAHIEGEDVEDVTERGKEKSRWRVRQHLEHIDLKNDK